MRCSSSHEAARAAAGGIALLHLVVILPAGCAPEVGECDPEAATQLFYTADEAALPAYGGQALLHASCGAGSFCHSETAEGAGRYGAPAGTDYDLGLAETAEQTELLRRGLARLRRDQAEIWRQVHEDWMPPGEVGAEVGALGPAYQGLPVIYSPEGKEMVRNWLACGAPVVERTTPRPAGIEPVGDIVPSEACATVSCDGVCVDTRSDPAHCGACGQVCEAGSVCSEGSCLAGGCPTGTTECAGGCVDMQTSSMHCGACGNACAAGSVCSAGTCVTSSCAVGLTECDGACVDTRTNASHCGGCGSPCAAGETCSGGVCAGCDTSVSFAAAIQPIFTEGCLGNMCHSGARPAADVSLEAGRSHAELVGVPSRCTDGRLLVAPEHPDQSYLVDKVTGIGICSGMKMPPRASLAASDIDLIRNWICAGAPNN